MPRSAALLMDPSRLRAVAEVLPDVSGQDEDFDRIARLASQALAAPTAFVTLITATDQNFVGLCGAPEAMGGSRGGPHEHSLCRHTVLAGEVVSITNTLENPVFSGNPIVLGLGLKAYLGIPLVTSQGHTLGTICVIDYTPRDWSIAEIDLLRDYAAVALGQLEAVANSARIRAAFDVALHDLKTPLSGLLMASSLVSQRLDSLPQELHPLFQVVEESTAAAVRLVNTLAAEQREMTVTPSASDPMRAAQEVISRLRPRADAKGMVLDSACTETCRLNAPPWVVEQILENLISNAIKYAPGGSVVSLGFRMEEGAGHFHISDQGPGFTEGDRKRMFMRYSRLSALPSGGESSTGLGLSIVKRLADQHGGVVRLLSGVDEGAEFRVSFPLA